MIGFRLEEFVGYGFELFLFEDDIFVSDIVVCLMDLWFGSFRRVLQGGGQVC